MSYIGYLALDSLSPYIHMPIKANVNNLPQRTDYRLRFFLYWFLNNDDWLAEGIAKKLFTPLQMGLVLPEQF